MNALVTLLDPPYAELTYALPECFDPSFWVEGLRVAVPLGRGPLRPGLVTKVDVAAPEGVRLREIAWPLEERPLLTPSLLVLLFGVADRQCLPRGLAVAQLLPFVKELGVTIRRLDAVKGKKKASAQATAGTEAGGSGPETGRDTGEDAGHASAPSTGHGAGREVDALAVARLPGMDLPAPDPHARKTGAKTRGKKAEARDAAFARDAAGEVVLPATLRPRQAWMLPPWGKKKLAEEIMTGRAHYVPPRKDAAKAERVQLLVSPPWPVRPGAIKQVEALEYLTFNGTTNRRALIRALGDRGAEVVDALVRQGCVRVESDDDYARTDALNEELVAPTVQRAFELNQEQKAAVADLEKALADSVFALRLLFGVTGSGKTAVYTEACRAALAAGKNVLLLAPEVALAHKLRRDMVTALPGADVVLYHGYQSQTRRETTFRDLAARRTPVLVVGTRSALFLPVRAGLVILDEEHDASFKQEDRVNYSAKEVAWLKCREENALLVLGSATPDIRTWHAALAGAFPVLRLTRRVTGRELPPVELVRMGRDKIMTEEDTLLAPESIRALNETVERGEQAIVLLNRRGFAPMIYCPDCKVVLSCPNCSVSLNYHRNESRLLCHYCGYSLPFPAPCPHCSHMDFVPIGEGTERTADYLSARYGHEVLRFDRDSTRRVGAMEELLARFARHEASILVGTQMLSKGHHFPDVTLAVVADGDLGLSLPDYRAAERSFQLLVQSAGRAGRGEKPGRVLIQTRDVDHYVWRHVMSGDYEAFYEEEVARRRRFRFPPFTRVSLLRFSYTRNDPVSSEAMHEAEVWLRSNAAERGVPLLGPVQSPIPVLNNRMRYQCLFKTKGWNEVRGLYLDLRKQKFTERLRITLNIDPYSML